MSTEPATKEDVMRRQKHLELLRTPYEAEWEDIAEFVIPRVSNWTETKTYVKNRNYDGTASQSLNILASGVLGYMVSKANPWFKFRHRARTFGAEVLSAGVADHIEQVELAVYDELDRSNFYEQVAVGVKMAGGIGTAITLVSENIVEKRLVFNTIHTKEAWIGEGPHKSVDILHRQFFMPAIAANEQFNGVSQVIAEIAKNDPYKAMKITHEIRRIPGTTKWESTYISENDDIVLLQETTDYKPFVCWRWSVNSDELYGRGSAHDVLPEILTVNQARRGLLRFAQFLSDPILGVPESQKGLFKKVPGFEYYYSTPQDVVQPLNMGGNYPIPMADIAQIQNQIKDAFSVDFFLLLSQQRARKTATEVMEMQGEKAALLSVMTANMENDYLSQLLRTSIQILDSAKRLPEFVGVGGKKAPPKDLIDQIEYTGMLPQLQKKYALTTAVQQTLGLIDGLVSIAGKAQQIGVPEMIDPFDFPGLAQDVANYNMLPQKRIREDSEVQKIRKARAEMLQQQAQQQAQQQQMNMAAQAKGDSLLGQMSGMPQGGTGGRRQA